MGRRIFVLGDSIGLGAWDAEGGWAARLRKHLNQRVIEGSNTIWVKNDSASGDTTRDSLTKLDYMDPRSEDVLILQSGVNDALYDLKKGKHWVELSQRKEILREILQKAESRFSQVVVVGDPYTYVDGYLPWDESIKLEDEKVKKYNRQKRDTTEVCGHTFVDLRSKDREDFKKYSYDGLHLNTEGHKLLYRKIKEEIEVSIF